MSNGFTVNSLATAYADRHLAHQNLGEAQRVLTRKRVEYDFKVTGFNASTAAMIVTLALAIITASVAIFVLWALVYNIRQSFMRAVEETALLPPGDEPVDPALLQRVANLNPVQRRNDIAAHLEIDNPNWQVVQYQLFDFKGWMNWTPVAPPPVVVERAQEQVVQPPVVVDGAVPQPAVQPLAQPVLQGQAPDGEQVPVPAV